LAHGKIGSTNGLAQNVIEFGSKTLPVDGLEDKGFTLAVHKPKFHNLHL
jgi:hypothetical protein